MSDLKARLEEVKRRAAEKLQQANSNRQQDVATTAPASAPVAEAQPEEKAQAFVPPPFEMTAPQPTYATSIDANNSSVTGCQINLTPAAGAQLDYRGDISKTHTSARDFSKRFISGIKRDRGSDQGSVRLGPALNTSLIDLNKCYEPQKQLGKGAYGVVIEAKEIGAADGTLRAVKEVQEVHIKESFVGYPPHLLREFDAVMRLQHPNILHGIALGKSPHASSVYLITEHGGVSLQDFLFSTRIHLSTRNGHPDAPSIVLSKAKCIAQQLLSGLAFLHDHCVLHRDIKTANILIDSKGVLRICDFGLARHYREGDPLTGGVVTLMYRAPEIHFGINDYSSMVDVWSAACVIGELLLKAPLFYANQELAHFRKLCEVLGAPDDVHAFPGMLQLPAALRLMQGLQGSQLSPYTEEHAKQTLKDIFTNPQQIYRGARECVTDDFIDLIVSMLRWNPKNRLTASEALKHKWFTTAPLPCKPEDLMTPIPAAPLSSNLPAAAVVIADEDEACMGKQQMDEQSLDHEEKRNLLNKGGDEVVVQTTEGTTGTPLPEEEAVE